MVSLFCCVLLLLLLFHFFFAFRFTLLAYVLHNVCKIRVYIVSSLCFYFYEILLFWVWNTFFAVIFYKQKNVCCVTLEFSMLQMLQRWNTLCDDDNGDIDVVREFRVVCTRILCVCTRMLRADNQFICRNRWSGVNTDGLAARFESKALDYGWIAWFIIFCAPYIVCTGSKRIKNETEPQLEALEHLVCMGQYQRQWPQVGDYCDIDTTKPINRVLCTHSLLIFYSRHSVPSNLLCICPFSIVLNGVYQC